MSTASRDFERLVEASLAGAMSPHEHEELERLLRTYPVLMDRYLEMTGLHLDLRHLATHPENRVAESADARNSRNRRSHVFRRIGWGTLVVACLAVVGFGLGRAWMMPPPPQAEVAGKGGNLPVRVAAGANTPPRGPFIAEAANAKLYGHWLAPRLGEPIKTDHEYLLTRGLLALQFPSGARAVLSAPCVFTAADSETLALALGRCSVHAPPGAEGFRVTTPSASVIDLGTRFAVAVDMTGETSLRVVDGAASVTPVDLPDATAVLLREGESAIVDQARQPVREIPAERGVEYIGVLPDRVVSYEATQGESGRAEELLTLTVQRGGENFTYDRQQLAPGRLVHFNANAGTAIFCTRRGDDLPEGQDRFGLLTDWSLVTGIINPSRHVADNRGIAAGMEIEFDPPIVNGPGPDVVLFDLQVLVGSEAGDAVRILTPDSKRRGTSIEITQWDLDLSSPYALELSEFQVYVSDTSIRSAADIATCPAKTKNQSYVRAKGLATGIDLSDLGYQPGETVSRLILEDYIDDGQCIDPVLIVALPPVDD